MTEGTLITRKDIAVLLGTVTARQVRDNERRWGLDKARVNLSASVTRYRRAQAMRILRSLGMVE